MTVYQEAQHAGPLTRADVDAMMQEIEGFGVEVLHPDDLYDYLFVHEPVARLLPSLTKQARDRIGSDGQLLLTTDDSSGEGREYLLLLLRQRDYNESILGITDDLSRQASAILPLGAHFAVTTDFVRAQ
jgi:hypothetical protein